MARRPMLRCALTLVGLGALALTGCTIRGVRGLSPTTTPAPATTTTTVAPTTTSTLPPTTTTVPPYPVPEVGECRGPVTAEVLVAPTDARLPGDCDEPHGSETAAVLELPAAITEYPADGLPDEVRVDLVRQCQQEVDAYVGAAPKGATGRVASRLVEAWYLPAASEWALGARWVRCDAAVTPLGPLTGSYAGGFQDALVGDQIPFPLTRCYDHALQLTFCEASHAFEATVEVKLPDGPEPPGLDVVDELRLAHCDPLTALAIGVGGMDEQPRLRTILLVAGGDLWEASGHIGLCIVGAVGGGNLNDSVRGIGSRPPPIEAPRPSPETSAP